MHQWVLRNAPILSCSTVRLPLTSWGQRTTSAELKTWVGLLYDSNGKDQVAMIVAMPPSKLGSCRIYDKRNWFNNEHIHMKHELTPENTYIPSRFKISLSSLISKGWLKSKLTLVRSGHISHCTTAFESVLMMMKGSGIFSFFSSSTLTSLDFFLPELTWVVDCCRDTSSSRAWFLPSKFWKHTLCTISSWRHSRFVRMDCFRSVDSSCNCWMRLRRLKPFTWRPVTPEPSPRWSWWTATALLPGKPTHVISFLFFVMISIAMSTLSAS